MLEDLRILIRHWPLIRFLVFARRHENVYKTLLGQLWFVVNPLAQVSIYYFLVVVIFRAHPREGVPAFIFIMLGVVHYHYIQQSVGNAGIAILSREALLLQINVEPIVFVGDKFYDSFKHFLISFAVYVAFHAAVGPAVTWRILAYPLIFLNMVVITWSCCLALASATVYVRDLNQIVQIVIRLLFYACPILYSSSYVPERFQSLYFANPVACLLGLFQWSVLGTALPPTAPIISLVVLTGTCLLISHFLYGRLRPGFTKAF